MPENYRILVIDDDDVDRMAVGRALRSTEVASEVREASSGEEAIQLLRHEHFDCALMDYQLPDRDGLSVLREVRQAGVSIPIIVMTGQGNEQLAVELMKAGANDYLTKSRFSLDHLNHSIRSAVRVYHAELIAAWADERLREETRITEALYRISNRLAAERDLERLVQVVTDEATAVTGAQFGAFFYNVCDEKGESYSLYTVSGLPREALQNLPMPQKTEIFAPTFRGEAIVRIDDLTQDPRYGKMPPYYGTPPGLPPVRSCLAVPVVSRSGETIGGLFFGHPEPARFSERDEKLVGGIAGQAAVAIDNARLYQALRAGEEQYRFLAESIPQIVWTADAGGAVDYCNRRWYEYTGLTPQRMRRDGWHKVLHPDDVERSTRRWNDSVCTGQHYEIEFRVRRSDGKYRWHLARAIPMHDQNGQVVKWFGTSTDIHDQKMTVRALEDAKNAAERANQAKDQFLAVLSHELRTPLTPVLGIIKSLELDGPLPDNVASAIDMIQRNVELEARLIDDLLDLTRISKGKVQLDLQVLDANACLRSALDICRDEISAKRLVVVTQLHRGKCPALADSARLQQVFWNLIKNAVKFTPEGGTVTLRSRRDPSTVEFAVEDNGIGIEPAVLSRIFNAFDQGEQSISRRFGGLGLGLAISKALIDLHGGEIVAESAGLGRGAVFTVRLPVAKARPRRKPRSEMPSAAPARRPARILLVDDHEDTNRAMKRLLERLGYSVATADSVKSALHAAQSAPFDVLISDIGLPDGSGLELMEQLLLRGPVKGIALSGFGMEEDIKRSHAAGFQEHLTKPINLARLQSVLDAIVAP